MSWLKSNKLPVVLIVAGLVVLGVSYGQVWWPDIWYWWNQKAEIHYSVDAPESGSSNVKQITPASTEFGLVIESIGVNERVAEQIDAFDPKIYLTVLNKFGVAQAKGSVPPGQVGTTYLFGHSTINVWEIGRYHAPFTLLDKVKIDDRIVTYYKGERFDYTVTERKVVAPTEVHYLTDKQKEPTLIVQTCDPPGENTKRLLLIAKLSSHGSAEQ